MKIVVAGPSKSGKSTIVNLLSQQYTQPTSYLGDGDGTNSNEMTGENYTATIGCRIVEIENFQGFMSSSSSSIEFWDVAGNCAGDAANCLPAIVNDSDGIIFVYNPLNPLQCSEIELWYELVMDVKGSRNDGSCLVLMHYDKLDATVSKEEEQTPSCLAKCSIRKTSYSTEANEMRTIVSMFLEQLSS